MRLSLFVTLIPIVSAIEAGEHSENQPQDGNAVSAPPWVGGRPGFYGGPRGFRGPRGPRGPPWARPWGGPWAAGWDDDDDIDYDSIVIPYAGPLAGYGPPAGYG